MFKIENNTIHLTRGDIATIGVKAKNVDGSDYIFKGGDIVRLSVYERKNPTNVFMEIDVPAVEGTTEVEIDLDSKDTKFDEIINKETTYWYEIVLNPETRAQTIIGYDLEGEKEFILYPEASEVGL